MTYLEEVQKGMELLAGDENTLVIGQAVEHKGHCLTKFANLWPQHRRLEMPVAEEFQTGFALGMSLTNQVCVSLYPRHNFLICGLSQLVNHCDKWKEMGGGQPHIVFLVVAGSENPLDPGKQHKANYSKEIAMMAPNINVMELLYPHQILPAFQKTIEEKAIHLITMHGDLL